MNQKDLLIQYSSIADIHARRLVLALERVSHLAPFNAQKCEELTDDEVAFFDMLTTRFSKLQDVIGAKLFPLLLDILGEDAKSFIDKLNRLEKLDYLDDADWWMRLREVRNQIAHDYPDDYEQIARHANNFVAMARELLDFWQEFKAKCNL